MIHGIIDDQRKMPSGLRKKLQSAGFANSETLVHQQGVGRVVTYAFCEMHKRYGKKQGQFGRFTIDFAHLKRYSSKHQKDAARAAERSLSWPSVIRTTSPSR